MRQRERKHHLTPERPAVEATLLGGAGRRHQEALVNEPEFANMLKIMLGAMGRFIDQFKAALPAGDVPILRLKLGRGKEVRQTVVFMAAQDNAGQAEEFANAVIQGSLNADEKPKLLSFIQPITPRRIPTGKALEEFFRKEGRPEDADVMLAYCDKHAGEVAFDDNGRPIFGPENHWDFIKYFVQDSLFLNLFEESLTGGELHDVILRVTNQDNSGSSVGDNRPAQAAVNSLIDRLQADGGLYALMDELDARSEAEWEIYKKSPEHKVKLRSVIAAAIEGGLTPTYAKTGGGVFGMVQDGKLTTVVAERANIKGDTPPTNITNSNTIEYSLLAIAAMCGLRPKDVEAMLKTKRETRDISAEQSSMLVQGVQAAEASYVPIRQQVKITRTPSGRGIPVQGLERDVHGPLGRAFDTLLFIGESMQTYKGTVAK